MILCLKHLKCNIESDNHAKHSGETLLYPGEEKDVAHHHKINNIVYVIYHHYHFIFLITSITIDDDSSNEDHPDTDNPPLIPHLDDFYNVGRRWHPQAILCRTNWLHRIDALQVHDMREMTILWEVALLCLEQCNQFVL